MEELILTIAEGIGACLGAVIVEMLAFGGMIWGFWKVLDLLFRHPERRPIDFALPGLFILIGLLALFGPSFLLWPS